MTTEALECRINVRVSRKEHDEIREAAEAAHLALSDYVRKRVLGRPVLHSRGLALRGELARLGDIIAAATAHAEVSEIQRALDAVVALSQRLRSFEGAAIHDR